MTGKLYLGYGLCYKEKTMFSRNEKLNCTSIVVSDPWGIQTTRISMKTKKETSYQHLNQTLKRNYF